MIPLWQHLPASQQQNLNTFQLFARCHNTYTAAKAISEPEIRQFCKHTICAVCPIKYTEKQICYDLRLLVCIGTDVWEFLEYYHNNFPLATIPPNLDAHVWGLFYTVDGKVVHLPVFSWWSSMPFLMDQHKHTLQLGTQHNNWPCILHCALNVTH